jgi:mono/diheme cytochrome c family protein
VQQTVVASIDGRSGAVKVSPGAMFQSKGDSALVCPSIVGGRNWAAGAYSPMSGLMYFPLQNLCTDYTVTIGSRKEASAYGVRASTRIAPGTDKVGTIHAISASTGRTEWKFEQRAAVLSLLTTGGGLLFGGDVAGKFRAFDQKTGEVLWQINLGSQITGFPVTFSVGDRQFIAVSTGQAVSTAAYLLMTPEIRPSLNSGLYVFALPAGWREGTVARARVPVPQAAASPISPPPPAAAQCRQPVASASPAALPKGAGNVAEGRRIYLEQQCVLCHGESLRGSASAPALADPGFRQAWRGKPAASLFDCLKTTMPPGRAGALSDAEYLHLLARIVEANGFSLRKSAGAGAEILDGGE